MNLNCAVLGKLVFGFLVLMAVSGPLAGQAQVNSWTSPNSGDWESPSSWSLGIPPAANQSVMITNAGFKAVGIFLLTSSNFPATMIVSNLTISAPTNSQNTLLLNFLGTPPLQVLGECTIGTNASILNISSGFQVQGDLLITNGSYVQSDAFTLVTNGPILAVGGSLTITNGAAFNFYTINLFDSTMLVDSGVEVTGQDLQVESGTFNFRSGFLSSAISVGGNGTGTFNQYGGQIICPHFVINDGLVSQYGGMAQNLELDVGEGNSNGGPRGYYSLYGGILTNSTTYITDGSFLQTGGLHTVGSIYMDGFAGNYFPSYEADYSLNGGFFTCAYLNASEFSSFSQISGTNSVSEELISEGNYELSGGTIFASSTVVYSGESVAPFFVYTGFDQSGGLHEITNELDCSGLYDLRNGTLIAPTIYLWDGGILNIGPSPATISNTVSVILFGGTIQLNTSTQSLASVMLYENSLVDFASGSSSLTFANSSDRSWNAGQIITVSNWNGSASGGGADQLFFGSGENGLTPAQLQQIEFVNPAGFPAETWFAKILPTGEVVPTTIPSLTEALSGTNLVLNWPGTFVLQAATNLPGPYVDVPGSSPYTNSTGQFPRRFFRLRQGP